MIKLRVALTFALSMCALASLMPAAARVPLESFAADPSMDQPSISPSGKYVAVPVRKADEQMIVVVDLDAPTDAKPNAIPMGKDIEVDWVRWKNDDRLLVGLVKDGDTDKALARAIAVDRDGKNFVALFSDIARFRGNRGLSGVANMLPADPTAILMGASDGKLDGKFNLYRVDVYSGRAEIVQRGLQTTFRWMVDPSGVPRVRWDDQWERKRTAIFVRKAHTDSWEMLAQYNYGDFAPIEFQGFTNDPNVAIVASNEKSDKFGLFEYNLDTRTLGKPIFQHPDVDVGHQIADEIGGPIYDTTSGKFVGIFYVTEVWENHYFDAQLKAIQNTLDAAFPDAVLVQPTSLSRDRSRVIVTTSGPRDPATYYAFDAAKNTARRLGRRRTDLPATELGDSVVVKYAARDGARLTGYLTLPAGKGGKNLPLVVLPHGGPKTRDVVGYHTWVQFLANRGYAVFQPNFRGSAGYGRAFMEAGYKQWGRRMQDDITDGAKALIADGTADANRICIFGWSYGGYAALAGGALTPDMYKCVVAGAGVSDLPLMVEDVAKAGTETGIYQYWTEMIGDPRYDIGQMTAVSPALLASNFKAPVLLIHGDEDRVVPIEQSKRMDAALRSSGKQVKFVILPKEGHSPNKKESRLTVLKELESFLATHIGN